MKTVEPDSADSMVFECDFDEPPEKVWRALTERELLEAWLTKDTSGESNATGCEIVSVEPHRRLRYRWRDREAATRDSEPREVDSVVTVELSAGSAGGTHLRLTHGEFKVVTGVVRPIATAAVRSVRVRRRLRQPISSGALLSLRLAA